MAEPPKFFQLRPSKSHGKWMSWILFGSAFRGAIPAISPWPGEPGSLPEDLNRGENCTKNGGFTNENHRDSTHDFASKKRNSVFKVDLQQNARGCVVPEYFFSLGVRQKNFLVVAVTTPYEMFVEDIQTRKARNFWT